MAKKTKGFEYPSDPPRLEAEKLMVSTVIPAISPEIDRMFRDVENSDLAEVYQEAYVNNSPSLQGCDIVVRDLTHDLAVFHSCLPRLDLERALDFLRMLELKFSIMNNGFIPMIWCLVIINGVLKGLNGNRSSHLFALRPELIRPGMKVAIVSYVVGTEQDAINFWTAFDKPGPVKKAAMFYVAVLSLMISRNDLVMSNNTIVSCVSTLGKHKFGDKFQKLMPEQRKCVIYEEPEFFKFVNSLVSKPGKGLPQKWLLRRTVLPVIYHGWKMDPQTCWEFWTNVRDFKPAKRYPLLKALHNFLRDVRTGGSNQNSGTSVREGVVIATAGFVMSRVCATWNRFWAGTDEDRNSFDLPPVTIIYDEPGPEGTRNESAHPINEVLVNPTKC